MDTKERQRDRPTDRKTDRELVYMGMSPMQH